MKKLLALIAITIMLFAAPAIAEDVELLNFTNFASATLAAPLSSTGTVLFMSTGSGALFPATGNFRVILFSAFCQAPSSCPQREILTLSKLAGDEFTIVYRGREGTITPSTWPAGAKITHSVTAAFLNALFSEGSSTSPCFTGFDGTKLGCWSSWDNTVISYSPQSSPTCTATDHTTYVKTDGKLYQCLGGVESEMGGISPVIVDRNNGSIQTPKGSGIPGSFVLESSHGADTTGAGFMGPSSSSGMAKSWVFQFPETKPAAGLLITTGPSTTAVVSFPTGTEEVDVVPLSAETPTTAGMVYPPAGISISTGSGWASPLTGTSLVALEVDSHATGTLTAAQVSNAMLYNTGQTTSSNVTITLPPAAAGYSFIANIGTLLDSTHYWEVKAGTSDKIYFDGTAGTDNHSVRATAQPVGSYLSCWTFKTDAYDWICRTGSGTWTAQ